MQDDGLLRIVAFADPTKMGGGALSLAFLDPEPAHHDAILETLLQWPEVAYLSETLGETAICLQLVCRDQEALGDLRRRISALEGVRGLRLLPESKVHKIRFTDPM